MCPKAVFPFFEFGLSIGAAEAAVGSSHLCHPNTPAHPRPCWFSSPGADVERFLSLKQFNRFLALFSSQSFSENLHFCLTSL